MKGREIVRRGDSIALRVLRLLVNGRVKGEKISYKNLLKEIYTIRCICWANQIMRCFIVVAPTRHRPRDDDDSGRMTLNGDGVLSAFILWDEVVEIVGASKVFKLIKNNLSEIVKSAIPSSTSM